MAYMDSSLKRSFDAWVWRNFLSFAALAAGCYMLYGLGWGLYWYVASRWWVAHPAKVIESRFERRRPIVRYEYTVAGNRYEADRVSFLPRASTREAPDDYVFGAKTTAYVDPQNPERSVLERQYGPGRTAVHLFVAALLTVMGIAARLLKPDIVWRRPSSSA